MRAIISKRGLAAVLVLTAVFFCGEGYYQAYGQDAGGANAAPVACIADSGRTIEATGDWEAQVTLDGSCSSDADSSPGTNDDINNFAWYELVDVCDPNRDIFLGSGEVIECNLPAGPHVIILTVTDSAGASDSNEAVFTIEYIPPLPPVLEPNDPNVPAEPVPAIIASGGDSNNTQGEPSGILAAGQGSQIKSGKIIGWGGQVVGVDLSSGFTSVAAGWYHSLGLKQDGSIRAWGRNYEGQCNVPSPNTGFMAVAAGYSHSLGLKQDGSIVAWGYNWYGQCNVPLPNTGFVSVAGGGDHSLGLKADGSIRAWGNNSYGQCNVPSPNTGFLAVAAGGYHSLGLKQDGSIVAWGDNSNGQCNVLSPNTGFVAVAAGWSHSLGLKADGSIVVCGDDDYGRYNVPSPNTGFTAVAGGGLHSLGLKSDGSIVAWGDNWYGQCNVPSPNTGFVAVAASWGHSLGLKQDGSIVAWGDNGYGGYGQCDVPSPNMGFVAVAGGGDYSLGLKQDGSIRAWGWNFFGQCNVPLPNTGFVAVAAGDGHSLGLKQDGSIVAWGDNSYGQRNVPAPNTDFVAVAAGLYHSLGLKQDGSIVAWGLNNFGQCKVPSLNTGFIAVAGGYWHSLGLKSNRSIAAWGYNSSGQCNVPAPNTGFVAVAGGGHHSLGLKQNGSIRAWGYNGYGQRNVPAPNTGFIAVAGGYWHSLGLKQNGSIVAWGDNSSSQCNVLLPNTGFIAIAAGPGHNLAIQSENTKPVACIVGGDQIVEADSNCEARIVLDGSCSSDEDSTAGTNDDIVSFDWYEANSLLGNGEMIECNLPLGEHVIMLEVTDWAGESDSNEVRITVEGEDTTAPVISCPGDIMVYARLPAGAAVVYEVNAVDLCDSQVQVISSPASGSVFAPGETSVLCTATDDSGNIANCSFTVTVIAPVEMTMHFTPGALNPRSQTNWLKAHFVLPEGYEIRDVDVNTPAVLEPLGIESEYINVFVDRGRFGESGVEIGFERRGFCDAMGDYGPGEVTVSGRLTTGQYFYGTDVLKVIANNFEYLGVLADYWLRDGCGAPDWCGGADADVSGVVDLVDFALFDGCCVEVF